MSDSSSSNSEESLDVWYGDDIVAWYDDEIPNIVAAAARGKSVGEVAGLIDDFAHAKGLLAAVTKSRSIEHVLQLTGYLTEMGYFPVKNEVVEAFDSILKLTRDNSKIEEFLEQWGRYLDFKSIRGMILICVRANQPIPEYLINVLNSSKPTIALTKRLVSLMDEIKSINGDTMLVYLLSPFFGQVHGRNDGMFVELRAISRMARIKIELADRKERLKKIDFDNITDVDLVSYLSSANSCLEDLLEVAVKTGKASAVVYLLSKDADPFSIDSISGEPLSTLPNLSADIHKILVSAQADAVFPMMKGMLQTGLIMDVISEFSRKLIGLEFAERKANSLPI